MKKSNPNSKPIGVKGLNQWGGYIQEEFLSKLKYPYAADVYQEMYSNDATIHSILYMMEQLIRGASWKVKPASDSKEDVKHAEFLETCMHDMDDSWAEFIQEVISMFKFGFSYHEVLYKIRAGKKTNPKFKSNFKDGKVGWRGFPIRSQHTLMKWEFDDNGNLEGMWQNDGRGNFFFIPMRKALLFRTKNSRGNPEGESLLRGAYKAWHFKQMIEEIEGIGIERDLAGMPVLKPSPEDDVWNPDDEVARTKRAMGEQLVRQIRRDELEGVFIPADWELELMNSGGNRQFDTNEIINRYDHRIAITLLSDIVLLGSDKVGSFALANIKKSLLSSAIEAQLQNIADIINRQAVEGLFNMNGIELEHYPKIVAHPIEVPDIESLSNFLVSAGESGMVMFPDSETENFLRRIVSMPEKDYTVDDLKREAKIRKSKNELIDPNDTKNKAKENNKNSVKSGQKD